MTDDPSGRLTTAAGLDIAIVGLDCIFPGAPDAATYWNNIVSGVDAITDVPASRWDPVHYDPESKAPDRFYQRRGGFVDAYARFDPLAYGVMPVAARGAEPDQLLALDLATRALQDAGYAVTRTGEGGRPIPGDRTGVIVGRGNYIGAGMTRLQQHVRTSEQLVALLGSLLPDLAPERLAALLRQRSGSDAASILAAAKRSLVEFTGRERHDDDVSLLVIKVR